MGGPTRAREGRAGIGRPSKFTPLVRVRFVRAILLGANYKTACAYAGLGYSTYRSWMALAEDELARLEKDPDRVTEVDRQAFVDFHDAVHWARGAFALQMLLHINRAAERRWRAAAWLLEKAYPQDYGPRPAGRRSADHPPKVAPQPSMGRSDDDVVDELGDFLDVLAELGIVTPEWRAKLAARED